MYWVVACVLRCVGVALRCLPVLYPYDKVLFMCVYSRVCWVCLECVCVWYRVTL